MKLSRWQEHAGAGAVGLIVLAWSSLLNTQEAVVVRDGDGRRAQADDAAGLEELRRTVEELTQKLDARDALITELSQRLGELERRLEGMPRQAAPPAVPPSVPLPAPEAPAAPEPEPRAEGSVAQAATPVVPSSPPRPAPEAPAAPEQEPPAGTVAQAAPPREMGQLEVDEEAVATALERALVQEGALLLPAGVIQVQPSLVYARQESAAPTTFLRDGDEVVAAAEGRSDNLTGALTLRAGLPFDSQLSLSLPYNYSNFDTVTRVDGAGEREESGEAAGFGDLNLTLSKGLLRERGWRPDLVAGLSWNTDTGQTDDGVRLGSGFNEITASLTASKSQDPLVFVGDLSYSHAFEHGGVQPGDAFGVSLGTVLAASPETSLRFFVDNVFFMETERDGRTVPGSDDVVGVLSIGASSILTSRIFLDFELGIGLTEAAPDYTIGVALPILFDLPIR